MRLSEPAKPCLSPNRVRVGLPAPPPRAGNKPGVRSAEPGPDFLKESGPNNYTCRLCLKSQPAGRGLVQGAAAPDVLGLARVTALGRKRRRAGSWAGTAAWGCPSATFGQWWRPRGLRGSWVWCRCRCRCARSSSARADGCSRRPGPRWRGLTRPQRCCPPARGR